ncbi:MAG: delta-aminolevulinic acid dehydratase [Candidatus Kapaibacterium sp.]
MEKIITSVTNLQKYIKSEGYKGFDPYDALKSPLFKLPFLRSNRIVRLGFQQVLKRLPFNLRYLVKIAKGYNPVTIGLVIQAYSYLAMIYPEDKKYIREIHTLLDDLEKNSSRGYSGICWGYDFDWEAKYAKIPAYTPTIVATGIITNSLFESYKLLRIDRMYEMCKSACSFVINDLNRNYEGRTFCWSYSPFDNQKVFNATLKGARLLSQVYTMDKNNTNYLEQARLTVSYVINSQNKDGSWSYAKGDSRIWVDNFHTGYVLDCLKEYSENTSDSSIDEAIKLGFEYYMNSFFENNIIPKYYNNSLYPIDSTSIAQSIITMINFKKVDVATNIVKWSIANMQNKKGYFYFQKNKFYTNRISYMRWTNAWIFNALTKFLFNVKK